MNDKDQKQLGRTLWNIADQLRGAMNADDFRDYMLSFLFLRYLSDNYEQTQTGARLGLTKQLPHNFVAGVNYTIERIDNASGPNSVLFGLGSAGGVANVSTKAAPEIEP